MSSTGIFRPTPSNGLSFRFRKTEKPKRRPQQARLAIMRRRIDRIAEAFAEGAETCPEAARVTGIPAGTVIRLWRVIRAELGRQAC